MKRLLVYMFLLNLLMGVSQVVMWRMFQYETQRLENVIRTVGQSKQRYDGPWCRSHIINPKERARWVQC